MKITNDPILLHGQLFKLNNKPTVPFRLPTAQGTATCHEVLRFLPGRRVVVKATWKGEVVLMKCFFGPKALRDYQREISGIRGFQAANVNTPELLQCDASQGYYSVITKYLTKAVSFSQVWENDSTKEVKQQLIFQVVQLIARLHQSGVEQNDVHLDNFIVCDNEIYAIDGGGVKVYKQPLTLEASWQNLALFLAVFYPRYDCYVAAAFLAYAENSHITEDYTPVSLYNQVLKKRKWRERYVKKCLRNCSDFKVSKSFWHFSALAKKQDSAALRQFFTDPEAVIARGKFLKNGRTNTVVISRLDDGRMVFIKKYQSKKNLFHRFLRTLVPSRARVSWRGAHLLKFLGIRTSEPIALLEKRVGPLTTCSYVVTEYLPGLNVMKYFGSQTQQSEDDTQLAKQQQQIISEIELYLLILQRSLVSHGDLKSANFMISDNQLYLVDLDSMRSFKQVKSFLHHNREDIKRFNQNWQMEKVTKNLFSPVVARLKRGEKSLLEELEL